MKQQSEKKLDVIVAEDWVPKDEVTFETPRAKHEHRNVISLLNSPIARKIIIYNLLALCLLIAGLVYLDSNRNVYVLEKTVQIVSNAEKISDVLEAKILQNEVAELTPEIEGDIAPDLAALTLPDGSEVYLYDAAGQLVFSYIEKTPAQDQQLIAPEASGMFGDLIQLFKKGFELIIPEAAGAQNGFVKGQSQIDIDAGMNNETRLLLSRDEAGTNYYSVIAPIRLAEGGNGAIVFVNSAQEIEALKTHEFSKMLQMFAIAALLSLGLSIALAATIANPLAELADAAEMGGERNERTMKRRRVRLPDLSGRPDEIGRLSSALRSMIGALYQRVENNEQFAADVAHEIKNPLASMQSAIGAMSVVTRDDQKEKLLKVIEHDVRRLDRLVTDISKASRLDSDLVKEEEENFDLLEMLKRLHETQGYEAKENGIVFRSNFPSEKIMVHGLENRLAQVFVNLISNAISFCEAGGHIRLWVRKREGRVLIVLEDTGPGIPEASLSNIFQRFYSHRSEENFGNHSGLGLAISKQIVEAHGGVIWAENIYDPNDIDESQILGARFVVGLPI